MKALSNLQKKISFLRDLNLLRTKSVSSKLDKWRSERDDLLKERRKIKQ
jgi:hypothetical protein